MAKITLHLSRLEPVDLSSRKGTRKSAQPLRGTQGKPTKVVIAEMQKLAKKDIFVTQS
jgi:hypothetical protein